MITLLLKWGAFMTEKTAGDFSREHEQTKATKIGYCASDFFWFGNSTPKEATAECIMCDHIFCIPLSTLITFQWPISCPQCKRKSIIIHDAEKWEKYIGLKLWEFDFFLDQYKTSHAIYNNGSRHVFPVKSSEMERLLALRCKNPNQIKTAATYLDGLAGASKKIIQMNNRVVKDEIGIWIDTASNMGEVFHITEDGWRIVENPPIMFRRFEHQLPLIVQEGFKTDFDEYMSLMNLSSDDDKLLYAGYAASLFLPDIDHPIFLPIGPQGSAKTTISLATKMLIDPSKTPLLSVPEHPEKLPLMFYFNYFPIFDNCNYLSQEASDMFCRACTGGGISTRKLYTDMDEVTFAFRSPIILNGISAPSMSPDLIDRSLQINLDRILEQNRKEKAIIEAKRDALLPRVRGYLMGIVSDALRNGPTSSPYLPRLADFARWADACTTAMGYKQGTYIEAYCNLSREAAKEAVRSDVLAETLLEYLDEHGNWDGSATELLKELSAKAGQNVKSPNWPKDSTRFSDAVVGKLKPGLNLLGWNVQRKRTGTKRCLLIWKDEVKNGGISSY